ncbi:MAG: alginate export family protein [Hyphomonadaceae bacterium]
MDLPTAIQSGTPILEVRARYESVSQFGLQDAEAASVRTRLGWQTAKWNDLVGLIEFEDVRQIGGGDYNDSIGNGAGFAVIADPDVTELNRLQLTWTPTEWLTTVFGRQRINLDDQRFIGAVGWRQDEQTFDALRLDADFGRFDATYAYLGNVNRIAAEARDWASASHVANASYTFSDPFKVQGFVYALDFDDDLAATTAENSSNLTYGVRASGSMWVDRFRLNYAAVYATQSDYGHYNGDYELDFYAGEISATLGPTTLRLDYESLEGDGVRGFQTPLATLHAFQGWADAFLTTPANGIEDLNASVIVNPRWRLDHLFNINLTARYHDFDFQRTGVDIGSEWNFSAGANITRRLSWIVKYADFDSENDAAVASRTKAWVGLEFRL